MVKRQTFTLHSGMPEKASGYRPITAQSSLLKAHCS